MSDIFPNIKMSFSTEVRQSARASPPYCICSAYGHINGFVMFHVLCFIYNLIKTDLFKISIVMFTDFE